MAADTTTATPSGLDVYPPVIASGGGGGTVNSVTAADETVVIGGTATDPTVRGNSTETLVASENITAGMWVNVFNSAGTPKVRKADASLGQGFHAVGFVVSTVTTGNSVKVYTTGLNTHVSGMLGGDVWLGTAGLGTQTPPTTVGYISQQLGEALSATEVAFEQQPDILIATPGTVFYGGTFQSQTFTASNAAWALPPGVTAVWGDIYAGGSSGGGGVLATAGNGGSAGEYCKFLPIPCNTVSTLAIVVGNGGAAPGAGVQTGNAGSNSSVTGDQTWTALGASAPISTNSGSGGGVRGGAGVAGNNQGNVGTAETPCFFGGSSGGGIGNVAYGGGSGGRLTGGAPGGGSQGGGGAASDLGIGGAGGAANVAGTAAAANTGAGGGGGGNGSNTNGGAGGSGKVVIYWIG